MIKLIFNTGHINTHVKRLDVNYIHTVCYIVVQYCAFTSSYKQNHVYLYKLQQMMMMIYACFLMFICADYTSENHQVYSLHQLRSVRVKYRTHDENVYR